MTKFKKLVSNISVKSNYDWVAGFDIETRYWNAMALCDGCPADRLMPRTRRFLLIIGTLYGVAVSGPSAAAAVPVRPQVVTWRCTSHSGSGF